MEDLNVWNAEDVKAAYEKRRARHIQFGATCLWCGEHVTDGKMESGYTGEGPDWMNDGDFGCDMSPDTTEDGVGSHNVSTDPVIWAAGKTVPA